MYSQNREEDKRWVIPSLDARLPQLSYVLNREIIRYWMIELTLTSGDVQKFYVKARTQQDALLKAKSLVHMVSIPKLRRKFCLVD